MSRRTILPFVLLTTLFAWTAHAGQDEVPEGKPAFEGFSREAQGVVERMLRSLGKVKTYADEGAFKIDMGALMQQPEQKLTFAYERPGRFRLQSTTHDVSADGKRLTVFARSARRYTVGPLERDVIAQLRPYTEGTFGIHELLLADAPEKLFAERFKRLETDGNEKIDDERCIKLRGFVTGFSVRLGKDESPVTIYLRESDLMIRRVDVDMLETLKKQFEDNPAWAGMIQQYHLVYDVRKLEVDRPVAESAFKFDPPPGARQVERLYGVAGLDGETAMQFELSGREAPEFELDRLEGGVFRTGDARGKVLVLHFMWTQMGMRDPSLEPLQEVARDYAGKEALFVTVVPGVVTDKMRERLTGQGGDSVVVTDPDLYAKSMYFEEQFNTGIVLVDRKGVVQGMYPGLRREEVRKHLRKDIDRLLAGESLEGAKPMSEEQIEEARDQRAAAFSPPTSAGDPVNEEHLKEAWSVRAYADNQFGFGQQSWPQSPDLWIRDADMLVRLSPEGKVTGELPIRRVATSGGFAQQLFAVGRMGRDLCVVQMVAANESTEGTAFQPPKKATLTAYDREGNELWTKELEVQNYQMPASLVMADVDGRAGDEVLFLHDGAVWVLDARGEVIARKPVEGWPQWLRVEDLDRDGRSEIYLRTNAKFLRLDYRPRE
jgi:outer membrane lipoprotein-sorting protein